MAGCFIFGDGRAFAVNNWAIDFFIEAIAAELPEGPFRAWVLDSRNRVVGNGLASIDMRELAPQFQAQWRSAIRRACTAVANTDPTGEHPYGLPDRDDWPQHFGMLAAMLAASEAGEPPGDLNPHVTDIIAPTGRRAGPGWDQ